jgi:hypothetical protein
MTGLHTGHTRVRGNFAIAGGHVGHKGPDKVRRANLLPEDKTVEDYLRNAGYHTGLVCKWRLYWETFEPEFRQAVRWGRWKAIRLRLGAQIELFDLKTDPGEKNDVAAMHPEIIARIGTYLRTARSKSIEYPIAID